MVGILAAGPAAAQSVPENAKKKIESLEFKDAKVLDAVRILSELSGVTILATREAGKEEVSIFLRNASIHDAIDGVARVSGLWYRYNKNTKAYLLMTAKQYRDDLVVYREDFTRIFTMRHQNVVNTAIIIENLFGTDRVVLNLDSEGDNIRDSFDEDLLGSTNFGGGTFGATNQSSNRFGSGRGNRFSSQNRNNRFSRSSNRNRGGRGARTSRDGTSITDLNENLSTEQLSALQTVTRDGLPSVSATQIEQLENREPPIFVAVNRQHNLLYVRTSDERSITQIERIVAESDRPTPQVLLEMKVLEVTVGDGFRSVFNFDYISSSTRTFVGPDGELIAVPKVFAGLGNFPLAGGPLLFSLIDDNIRATIELLEEENKIKVLATPMVLAANDTPAQLFIGDEVVIRTGAEADTTVGTTGATNTVIEIETEIRDVGDTLRIIPRINSDRTVSLLVQQDNSRLKPEDRSIPVATDDGTVVNVPLDTIATANIEGLVLARDGYTVAIGGLIRTSDQVTLEKVPLLGDVPVVGRLFRREELQESKSELVLLITPHIFFTPAEAENQSRATLARLSSNPSMESFGFGGSRRDAQPEIAFSTGEFISLTRFAAQYARGEGQTIADVQPAYLDKEPTALLQNSASLAQPENSWQRGGLFVTTVLFDLPPDAPPLGPERLRGNWLAATFEVLPGTPEDRGKKVRAYLVSDRPFGEVVRAADVSSRTDRPRSFLQ